MPLYIQIYNHTSMSQCQVIQSERNFEAVVSYEILRQMGLLVLGLQLTNLP
jgi:hypothetical protein